MKRIIAFLLVLAAIFVLCACGEPTIVEKEVEKIVEVIPKEYEQFKDIVDALVKEDYDAAQALIEAMKPVPETPPTVEVTITKDNFFDYFEYIEFPEYNLYIEKDAEGSITSVTPASGYYLKEEFSIAKERVRECKVEAGIKYVYYQFWQSGQSIIADLDNFTYTITGKPTSTFKFDELREGNVCFNDGEMAYNIRFGDSRLSAKGTSYIILEDTIELVSASGTLYLYE